jgi:hypothetical protein
LHLLLVRPIACLGEQPPEQILHDLVDGADDRRVELAGELTGGRRERSIPNVARYDTSA